MRWLFSRAFWGIVLILLGVSLFLERVYGINLPLWGIFWSLVIIGIGISLILPREKSCCYGGEWRKNMKKGDVIFEENIVEGDDETNHYNVVFGKGEIDLTKIKPSDREIKVDTVFGSGVLKISKDSPIKIKATSAFGEVQLPNGHAAAFGDAYYESENYDAKKPYIFIKANAVFGRLDIISE